MHSDDKLHQDIIREKIVNYLPILISENVANELLVVPKMSQETGK